MKSAKNLINLTSDAEITLSSALPGNGVHELLDGRADTFWQSSGSCPHSITFEFHELKYISSVELYLDYSVDESFTPHKISVEVGQCLDIMTQISTIICEKPQGWISLDLRPSPPADDLDDPLGDWKKAIDKANCIWCSAVRVVIESAHQGGKDIHVRQVQILGPARALDDTLQDLRTFV